MNHMLIWDKSPRLVLSILLGSTDQKLYFSEIIEKSSLAYSTVYLTLKRLTEAEVVFREQERFLYDSPFREARVYYTLNPQLVDYLRLPSVA